jgi:ketopantoate reductase
MELDALLGELARRAGRVNVAVPVSAVLYALLLPQAAGRG